MYDVWWMLLCLQLMRCVVVNLKLWTAIKLVAVYLHDAFWHDFGFTARIFYEYLGNGSVDEARQWRSLPWALFVVHAVGTYLFWE